MNVTRGALKDTARLMQLFRVLGGTEPIGTEDHIAKVLAHPGTEIWCAREGQIAMSMVTLHILPNVSWGGRPYALIENVVTDPAVRGRGFGAATMRAAISSAQDQNAYKIMLMTGRKAQAHSFYEQLGFRADEKWAMTWRAVPERQY